MHKRKKKHQNSFSFQIDGMSTDGVVFGSGQCCVDFHEIEEAAFIFDKELHLHYFSRVTSHVNEKNTPPLSFPLLLMPVS
jgi:hypothetical protein